MHRWPLTSDAEQSGLFSTNFLLDRHCTTQPRRGAKAVRRVSRIERECREIDPRDENERTVSRRFAGEPAKGKKGDAMSSMRISRKSNDEVLPQLSGQQLLLLTVLGRLGTRRMVRQELDRRAMGRAATTCRYRRAA